MKRHVLSWLVMLGTATLPLVARGQAPDPVTVVTRFHGALAAGDSTGALAMLLPGVVIYEAGGVEASRDEYRQHHLPADMAFSVAVTRAVTRVHADSAGDVAWVLTESHSKGTFRERAVDARGVETMVLRRTTEGWRIAHIHWSSRRG